MVRLKDKKDFKQAKKVLDFNSYMVRLKVLKP